MSSPQRQVGSRRLPPLPKLAASSYVKTGKGETKSQQTPQAGSGKHELSTDIFEGPFRPTLTPETFNQVLSKGGKSINDKSSVDNRELVIPGKEKTIYYLMGINPSFISIFEHSIIQFNDLVLLWVLKRP